MAALTRRAFLAGSSVLAAGLARPEPRVATTTPVVSSLPDEIRRRLTQLHFLPPQSSGAMDGAALVAFQRAAGLPADGAVDATTVRALHEAVPTRRPRPDGPALQCDLRRQLIYYEDTDGAVWAAAASTGSGAVTEATLHSRRAVTPAGVFTLRSRPDGWSADGLALLATDGPLARIPSTEGGVVVPAPMWRHWVAHFPDPVRQRLLVVPA